MRRTLACLVVIVVLVVIGTLEAAESARQLAELTDLRRIRPNGAGLTGLGFAASASLYFALGWWLADGRAAVRLGALVGLVAGLVGGVLRAMLVSDAVREAIARNAVVPDWFAGALLAIFVAASAIASIVGGAVIAWAGSRLARASRASRAEPTRPPA